MSRLRLICTSHNDLQPVTLKNCEVGIGRHPDNEVLLRDDLASRFHCAIDLNDEGMLCLKDLGSRNGTKMNGQRVSEVLLSPGDIFSVGKHVFEIERIEEPAQQDPTDTITDLDQTVDERATRTTAAARPASPRPAPARTPTPAAGDAGPAPAARVRSTSKAASPYTDRRTTPRRADENWKLSLRDIISNLTHNAAVDESIALLDSHGNPGEILDSDASGPLAMRLLLLAASVSRATDIHCEPKGEMYAIRMRVDGQLIHIADLPNDVGDLVNGIVRTACQMKQAARDAVQDGSFSARIHTRRIDYRASLTPTVHAQKLVVRVLDAKEAPHKLGDMHLPKYMYERLIQIAGQDTGLVLTCGPTGCGKTTTLYNLMREVDREHRNVVTIEDPVEYYIDNVTQIPAARNQSFGDLLRSVLRQDPDVILVGEIRDQETARVAMQAAMTGHVVLSTVHTRDSMGAIFRLLDLGVEGYLVANSLDLVVAQRLLRVLCEHCKRNVRVTPGQQSRIGKYLDGKADVYTATGCKHCLKTGYKGRQAIFEMLNFDEDLRDIVLKNPTIKALRQSIEKGVFTTLRQAGWRLAAAGKTSLEEVERVVGIQ